MQNFHLVKKEVTKEKRKNPGTKSRDKIYTLFIRRLKKLFFFLGLSSV
ncbi:MAG: hypothetical protein IEMM0006_2174 [bacterium]|nr:MAG: hypothetical protein IEMM0006_2174 [bacterium]